MATFDNTEVRCILLCLFLGRLCEEDAELERVDEGGELLMVLRVGLTCLV